eukprot:159381-Prorocentrum_minimum.AAC.1
MVVVVVALHGDDHLPNGLPVLEQRDGLHGPLEGQRMRHQRANFSLREEPHEVLERSHPRGRPPAVERRQSTCSATCS